MIKTQTPYENSLLIKKRDIIIRSQAEPVRRPARRVETGRRDLLLYRDVFFSLLPFFCHLLFRFFHLLFHSLKVDCCFFAFVAVRSEEKSSSCNKLYYTYNPCDLDLKSCRRCKKIEQ